MTRWCGLIFLGCVTTTLWGQDSSGRAANLSDDQQREKYAAKLGAAEASRYRLTADSGKTIAELRSRALLHWSNPLDSVSGAVVCWLIDGRPVAIASIYKYFAGDKSFSAEFQSLYPEPIAATRDGLAFWSPTQPGIIFKTIDDEAPRLTTAQLGLQMRQIARRFSAKTRSWDTGELRKLRLLPQPILIYRNQQQDLFGGVFSFVVATDPDVLLLIETSSVNGKMVWQYGLARLSINETKVELDHQEVWAVPKQEQPYQRPSETYTILQELDEPEI
ncbi:MAG: hypothetical protein MI861_10810 [Pirellulales bacterium]|nr:hypothetical protein [Pirellulales bacterium]